jgi:hypothetical protein
LVGVANGDAPPEREAEGEQRNDLSARSSVAADPAKEEDAPPRRGGRLLRAAVLSTMQPVMVTVWTPSMRPRAAEGIPALTRPAIVLATSFSGGTEWYWSETTESAGVRGSPRGAPPPEGPEIGRFRDMIIIKYVPRRKSIESTQMCGSEKINRVYTDVRKRDNVNESTQMCGSEH